MKKIPIFIAVAAILLAVAYIIFATGPKQEVEEVVLEQGEEVVVNGDDDEMVFCTMDAKECPDGSYVGRVAPDCEFAPCPGEEGFVEQEAFAELEIVDMEATWQTPEDRGDSAEFWIQ